MFVDVGKPHPDTDGASRQGHPPDVSVIFAHAKLYLGGLGSIGDSELINDCVNTIDHLTAEFLTGYSYARLSCHLFYECPIVKGSIRFGFILCFLRDL